MGQNIVDQQRGTLGHASGATTGTNATPLATESHQALMMTVLAAHAQKAMFQATALEVIIEFPLHIQGNRTALLLHERQEMRVILVDNLVEKRLLRPMTLIPARALVRGNPCRTHGAILCKRCSSENGFNNGVN